MLAGVAEEMLTTKPAAAETAAARPVAAAAADVDVEGLAAEAARQQQGEEGGMGAVGKVAEEETMRSGEVDLQDASLQARGDSSAAATARDEAAAGGSDDGPSSAAGLGFGQKRSAAAAAEHPAGAVSDDWEGQQQGEVQQADVWRESDQGGLAATAATAADSVIAQDVTGGGDTAAVGGAEGLGEAVGGAAGAAGGSSSTEVEGGLQEGSVAEGSLEQQQQVPVSGDAAVGGGGNGAGVAAGKSFRWVLQRLQTALMHASTSKYA
jgi:SWI/SNF-related matrix-associated actin-dependent regulator 1 of chromatin subfamily A